MRLVTLELLSACLGMSQAFRETSPFVLFSNSKTPSGIDISSDQALQSRESITNKTQSFLRSCPSDYYIIISQPGVAVDDLQSPLASGVLRNAFEAESVRTRLQASEVVGDVSASDIQNYLQTQCGASATEVDFDNGFAVEENGSHILHINFPPLPISKQDRSIAYREAEEKLRTLINLFTGSKYTVIYLTTPVMNELIRDPSYEPIFMESLHTEMKRQSNIIAIRADNTDVPRTAPLFETYQFLTPGLFMGLTVSLLLLGILSVGIYAVASLEVSYGAFEKDMGPAAQKKQG